MKAMQVYIKGNELFGLCHYEEALDKFLSILDTDNRNEHLLLKISQCYQELEQFDAAIDFLERLLNVSLQNGNYKKAIAICKRILSIDPDDAEVVLKLANIFRKLNQYGEACYYYKIVAQHYEYSGFIDKAIEVLQLIKELGHEGVEDLLEIVKKEYKRGAKAKADKNIEAIIKELKDGDEYTLLDVALNLALSNSPNNFNYVLESAKLYFRTGRLICCLHLCLWGLHLNPKSSTLLVILVKVLWALGKDEAALKLSESILKSDYELDDQDAAKNASSKVISLMKKFEKEKQPVQEELTSADKELSYLEREDFTAVDHSKIDSDIIKEEMDKKLKEAVEDKTSIMDTKRNSKYSPRVLEGLREAEILISEKLYDKAGLKLFSLLEEEPGNDEIKILLSRVVKMSGAIDSSYMPSAVSEIRYDKTTDEMIAELENFIGEPEDKDRGELRATKIIETFNDKLRDVLLPSDYMTIFDLGIAYMELDLWPEAAGSFQRVVDYLSESKSDGERLTEAKIYWAYSESKAGNNIQTEEAAQFINGILNSGVSEKHKLVALYYMAQCYETLGDKKNAKKSYSDIIGIDPGYRDVEVRASMLGN
ncbi:MAG: tetratricopeptide repeat protein [Pseudomonadota bacterium]